MYTNYLYKVGQLIKDTPSRIEEFRSQSEDAVERVDFVEFVVPHYR